MRVSFLKEPINSSWSLIWSSQQPYRDYVDWKSNNINLIFLCSEVRGVGRHCDTGQLQVMEHSVLFTQAFPPSLPLWYPDQVNVIPQLTINLTALITRTIHSSPVQSRGEPGQLSANMGRTARQSVTWLKHQQNFISLHASLWPPGGHRVIGVVVLVVVGSLVVSCC